MAKRRTAESGTGLFSREDWETLRRARRMLADLLPDFDRARACGIDCEFLVAQRESIDSQLDAIERHYMTPPPA